jgi:CRISPR-associated protein Cas2
MLVIDLEAAPPKLRGLLSRWCVEVRAGLYVGSYGKAARQAIWAEVERLADGCTSAVLIYDAANAQGFEFQTLGRNRREPVLHDGLWLVQFKPPPAPPAGTEQSPTETDLDFPALPPMDGDL